MKRLRLAIVIGISLGLVVWGLWRLAAIHEQNSALGPSLTSPASNTPAISSVRSRLTIPRLGVDAPVVTGEVDAHGEFHVPADPATLALAAPGATLAATRGTTLVSGHVNFSGVEGALSRLAELGTGDEIVTHDEAGRTRLWRVERSVTVAKDELPADIAAPDGPRRLVLVTCTGTVHFGQYDSNVVVYAS